MNIHYISRIPFANNSILYHILFIMAECVVFIDISNKKTAV